MLYNFKDTKEYGMEHRRYTKENIKNIAEGVLKIYSDQSYPVKVLEIANNLDLQVFDSMKKLLLFIFILKLGAVPV